MVRKSKKELNIIGSTSDNDEIRIEPGMQRNRKSGYYDYEPPRRDRNLDYDEYERDYDSYDSGYDDYDMDNSDYDSYDDLGGDYDDDGFEDFETRLRKEEESYRELDRKIAANRNRTREERRMARKNAYQGDFADGYDEQYDNYDENYDNESDENLDNYDEFDDGYYDDYDNDYDGDFYDDEYGDYDEFDDENRSYKDDKHYYKRSLEDHPYGGHKGNNGKKHKNKKVIILRNIGIIVVAVLVVLFCVWKFVPSVKNTAVKTALKSDTGASVVNAMIGDDYNKNVLDTDFDKSKIVINDGVTAPEGYTTVALFGIDARNDELTTAGSRSDSMIVVSVEEATEEIKMASIYRDTFLLDSINDAGEYYIGKANAAYALEGPLGAVNMLNRNWDLAVTDYVVVNFGGLANIIDELGGLTLTISDEEVEEINYRMDEQIKIFGGEYVKVENSGTVKLNGAQATAFCRIRAVDFTSPLDGQVYSNDYGRTARQRYALTEIMKQFKNLGISKLVEVGNNICANNVGDNKFIATSLSLSDLMKFLSKVVDMNITGQEAFPSTDHIHGAMLDCGDSLVADTLEENVTLLHEFLYNQTGYSPSSDLYTYSAMISNEEAAESSGGSANTYDENGDTDWEDITYEQWEEPEETYADTEEEYTDPPADVPEETWEENTEIYDETGDENGDEYIDDSYVEP